MVAMTFPHARRMLGAAVCTGLIILTAHPAAAAADGSVLTTVENQVVAAAKGWETTVANAARSLFWILAGIEVGTHVGFVDRQNARLGEGIVGQHLDLAAGVAAGRDTDVHQRHRQQADGDLLAGGDHHVELAGAGAGADLRCRRSIRLGFFSCFI